MVSKMFGSIGEANRIHCNPFSIGHSYWMFGDKGHDSPPGLNR